MPNIFITCSLCEHLLEIFLSPWRNKQNAMYITKSIYILNQMDEKTMTLNSTVIIVTTSQYFCNILKVMKKIYITY